MTATATLNEEATWACCPGEELLAGYRAAGLLGDGVRTESWVCWSERHLAHVAVKVLRPDQLASAGGREALRREAASLDAVHHPAFPRLLEARPDAPIPHLVTELVEGPTLAALVDDGDLLGRDEVILLGIQLAAALHHLHTEAGLVHLDVTPSNIVLRDGRPVLLDLGLASAVGAPARSGPARGTPGYMSPEQRRRRPAAPSMDVYALGVTLEEVLTGRRPVTRRSSGRLLPRPPRRGSLAATVATFCADTPSDRPASAWDAARLLDSHLDGPSDDRPVPAYAW